MKKVIGWILFALGILISVTNLGWGLLVEDSVSWFAVIWPVVLILGGWKLAHPKSKEELAKKEKELK